MNTILALESNKYPIKLDNFEGPLDLLCHLIDKNKMDIYDIKISEIADQYIEYIEEAEKLNLDIASEFLIMVSTLLYIKSKGLLPSPQEDEEELTEEELIRRIIEYKKYKEISKIIRENYLKYSNRFFKFQESIELPKQKIEKEYTKELIPELYKKIVDNNKTKINKNATNIEKIAIIDKYTVGSKVKEMYRELFHKKRFVFNRMFAINKHDKEEVVTAFSGLLELSRRSKVVTAQNKLFGDIVVERVKKNV